MGIFGNLAGMVNDRSRGFFDGQRKKRMEVRAGNKQRMREGERFNNRGLNALTSRASTNRFGFTAKGREAYQQKMNNAGIDFAKSSAGQALQHNDGALQALTYASEAQARANLARDFGINTNTAEGRAQVDASIAAAKASGGFGRNRQVWAAQQLSNTGTGYANLEQVSKTIARAANGNESQAMALAGNINASTKSVGRGDLAPGFGKLSGLALAEMNGKATYRDEKTGETGEYDFSDKSLRDQSYHKATLAATGSQDAMTLLRGKTPGVTNMLKALREEIEVNPNNYTARSTVNDLINSMSYGPQPNQQELITMFSDHDDFKDQIDSALQMQKQGRAQSQYDAKADNIINPPPGA
jgi:hypothetical protein